MSYRERDIVSKMLEDAEVITPQFWQKDTPEPPDWLSEPEQHAEQPKKAAPPPSRAALTPSDAEIGAANLTPRCIVDQLLYADVGQIAAPGSTGKTTLLLHEAACIAIGLPVWGHRTVSPGWTLIVTAEDQRPQLLARLREITAAMELTPEQRRAVFDSVVIWDVTGDNIKLTELRDGNIRVGPLADSIVERYRNDPPVCVTFDPLVSFGASEQAVNDNEQGIITAARRIVRGLNCAVRLIHHVGKANARNATLDQYSGRGGSDLADGSRMTTVLQPWTPESEGSLRPPAGCRPGPESSITVYARAKLSYAPPNLPRIWIRRTGFAFEHFAELRVSPEEAATARADQIERFLISQFKQGKRWTSRQLEDAGELSMTRKELRTALATLEVDGRVILAPLPKDQQHGARKAYLHPTHCAEQPESDGAIP